jgi:Ca2+-binding EF-hand superfamily protein
MPRSILSAVTIMVLLAGSLLADDDRKADKNAATPTHVTVTKVNPRNGSITVKFTDDKGKEREKTFQLTRDVRLLDDTGRIVNIDVFESGDEALVVEREGKLQELRRAPHVAPTRRLSDAVRTLIEMTDCEEGCAEDLQRIYDMLRKLDTGKNGKIDPHALKAEGDRILQERVQEVFNRLDTNKDGKISRDEARGLIKEHFDRIDTNKDGFIEHGELLKAAKERREHKAAETQAIEHKPAPKEKN